MSPTLAVWNTLAEEEAASVLLVFCGSRKWARCLARARPLRGRGPFLRAAERCWTSLAGADWLESIAAHPEIGASQVVGLEAREQSAVAKASSDTRTALDRANRDYRERFGWTFLICARGKTAEQMLLLCRERLHNEPRTELRVAAEEQKKITRLRLEDWLT